jgi:hypothetical protein
VLSVHCRQS